jgi:hypothetical protein
MKTFISGIVVIVLGVTLSAHAGDGNSNTGVLPVNSTPFGKTYGEWANLYNNWLWHFPAADNPLLAGSDGTGCGLEQSDDHVWFLAGALGETVVRDGCVVPAGTALFFPVTATISFVPLFGSNEEEVRADAATDISLVDDFTFSVDGVPLSPHRASSPHGGFVFTVPEGSFLNEFAGLDPGDYDPAVTDGYWVMLAPLPVGPHTIHYAASGHFQNGEEFAHDVTHNLVVAPHP